jgi:hypothetical protein
MKKGIASILLVLYVAFSTGVVISFHYCMDEFDSAQLGAKEFEICNRCGMHVPDSGGCCNDEVKIFKIADDQQVSALSFKFSSPEVIVATIPLWDDMVAVNSSHHRYLNNHSPPLSKQDTYLQNCVFRI